jgi:hypothetical protein
LNASLYFASAKPVEPRSLQPVGIAGGAMASVVALWRYPVKSLQGEPLTQIDVGSEGLVGDRRFAIFDRESGMGVTGRRSPSLLFGSARLLPDGSARITLPDGRISEGDEDLSDWLQRPVTLRRADEPGPRRYESPADFENESDSDWNAFDGSPGAFHDLAVASVSLLATSTIGAWDPRRFRANVLLDMGPDTEVSLVGHEVMIGEVGLSVRRRLGRCVMTTRPQPGGIERDLDVLRTINRERDGCLAVGALVAQPGRIAVGDAITAMGATGPFAARAWLARSARPA